MQFLWMTTPRDRYLEGMSLLPSAPDTDEGPSSDEIRQRVIYALMLPAVRLARVFGVPLKMVERWLHMAYFHELRDSGLKMREAAGHLKVSMRKAALLSKQLKDNFLQPEQVKTLPRRIEFCLWAQPLSFARLQQAMPEVEPVTLTAALDQLVAEGRLTLNRGRTTTYAATRPERRLVRDNWLARIDGLNNLLGTVSDAVYGRFFAAEPRAFARTLSFRMRSQDREKLQALYEEQIWPTLVALDEASRDDENAEQVELSLCWAPYEYLRQRASGEPEEEDS